jgi:hypothetical protein
MVIIRVDRSNGDDTSPNDRPFTDRFFPGAGLYAEAMDGLLRPVLGGGTKLQSITCGVSGTGFEELSFPIAGELKLTSPSGVRGDFVRGDCAIFSLRITIARTQH